MYENIKALRPHFFSLREIENNVSLDIKLPTHWKYDTIVKTYSTITIKVQDKNDKFSLLSLISTATQDGFDIVFACAKEVVLSNQEEEEKMRLFKEKVAELQDLFSKSSLDKLKDLSFNNEGEIHDDSARIGLAGEVKTKR